jgi:hypothetical protein
MTKPVQLYFLFIIILFVSCEKKISDLEFEKNVMTEILPDLIDSTCYDTRVFTNSPPLLGESIFDKEGNYIGTDSTKVTNEQRQRLAEWKSEQTAIEKDTSKIIIAFDPLIKRSMGDVKDDFEKHFKGAKIWHSKKEVDTVYTIDFKNIKLKGKFELRDVSEFPEGREIWKKKYDFVFSGVVYFSRIQFDRGKKFGILDGGFVCGRLCGQGFRIYIKKIKNKWVIDKIDNTWVS